MKLLKVPPENYLALATDLILLVPEVKDNKDSFNFNFRGLGEFNLDKITADKVFHETGRVLFNQRMRLN